MKSIGEIRSHERAMEVAGFITKEAKRIAKIGQDHTDQAGELLATLDRDELPRQARIQDAFAEMADARAELLASPLYADAPDLVERKLSAISDARKCREKANTLRGQA